MGSNFNVKNDPTSISAPRVCIKYKLHLGLGGGQILTLKNDPTCILAIRVVIKF